MKRIQPQPRKPRPTKPLPAIPTGPFRILIVDDERHNRQLLEVSLKPEGYSVVTAASGAEALAMIEGEAPDLVLLDVMMPEMDGYEVASWIKHTPSTKSIPIIMVTALDDRDARMRGLQAGAEEFLAKPVDRAELCVRVKNMLRLKAYGDYHDRYSHFLEDEVKSRTAELSESERLYRETFDAAPVGIVHAALSGRWLRVNQRLCDLLGYSSDELRSRPVQDLIAMDEVAGEAAALRALGAGMLDAHVIEEKRYRRRDGGFLWARVNIAVHRDNESRPQHFVIVIEDISERRALEMQVAEINKMDAIGRLASGVAHDFNNLLTVILGFAELVKDDAKTSGHHKSDLEEIIVAAQRARSLTHQLLAFGGQQVLHTAAFDVNTLVREMTGMLGRLVGKNIEIGLALSPDVSSAMADRHQLERVVTNLVVNARDAMPDGGSITIETADVDLGSSGSQDEYLPGPYVMVSVTDTGTGMTKETRRRLFEPFYTTKAPGNGSGLGLSTTYGIVKQSNGHIAVSTEPGHGSVFKVYLPRSTTIADAPVVAPQLQPVPVVQASETVLLVEDEPGVRRLSRRILDNAGYHVLEAVDGDDAEKLFSQHGESIHLVLTDMVMPGCGGPELLERLHKRAPTLRVLFMSGYAEAAVMRGMNTRGDCPFIQKPFTAAQLVQQVRQVLDR